MIYVTLPEDFIAIDQYPGYYYTPSGKHVYSIKSGELKPLKIQKPNKFFSKIKSDFVQISHKGKVHYIVLDRLKDLPITTTKIRIHDDY